MAKPTVLLYPGAGSDRDHASLVAVERSLGSAASVERLDFPYRREGRRAPDRAPKLMASIRDDLAGVSRRRGAIVMGGRSMGGRMTTMVAADVDGVGPVARLAGLVLICYPLHPPGKPDELRVDHLAVDLRAVPVHLGDERSVRVARRTPAVDRGDPGRRRARVDRGWPPRPQGRRRRDRVLGRPVRQRRRCTLTPVRRR